VVYGAYNAQREYRLSATYSEAEYFGLLDEVANERGCSWQEVWQERMVVVKAAEAQRWAA